MDDSNGDGLSGVRWFSVRAVLSFVVLVVLLPLVFFPADLPPAVAGDLVKEPGI